MRNVRGREDRRLADLTGDCGTAAAAAASSKGRTSAGRTFMNLRRHPPRDQSPAFLSLSPQTHTHTHTRTSCAAEPWTVGTDSARIPHATRTRERERDEELLTGCCCLPPPLPLLQPHAYLLLHFVTQCIFEKSLCKEEISPAQPFNSCTRNRTHDASDSLIIMIGTTEQKMRLQHRHQILGRDS